MTKWHDFHGPNAGYVLELYERYRQNPDTVDASTREFFKQWTPPENGQAPRSQAADLAPAVGVDAETVRCAVNLVQAIREYGHLAAQLDPLGSPPPGDPALEMESYGLSEEDLRALPAAIVTGPLVEGAANAWEAIEAADTKPFGFMKFTPGPGVGGHCLPIDPSYLSWRVKRRLGQTFRFVELANDVNEHMPDYVVNRAMALLNRHQRALNGSRVLVLGLSYKAGTSDWRESPSIAVVERLLAMGADVRACEPYLPEAGGPALPAPVVECTNEEVAAADLVVLLVDHPDFPLDDIAQQVELGP